MTDPEVTTGLPRADFEEVAVDEADGAGRAVPLEAEPADVAEQRHDVPVDDDEAAPDA